VAVEPLRESAHRALIGAHLAEGNRVEALRQLARLRHLLREELGVEPSLRAVDLLR
jgi:DNA-binding SARP family transcriptional activator